MAGAGAASALTGWPAPWRVVAVLVGVLPVQGALKNRPPYRYRLCSGPALAGVLVAVMFTVYGVSWLMPQGLSWHRLDKIALAAVFELVISGSMCGSAWLLVAHGGKAMDVLGAISKILTENGVGPPRSLKRTLSYLLMVCVPAWKVGLSVWRSFDASLYWGITLNHLPVYFNLTVEILLVVTKMSLLSLCVHLMQVLADTFNALSADLRRELQLRPSEDSSKSTARSPVPRPVAGPDRPPEPVRVLCPSPDSAGVLPSAPRAAGLPDALAGLRERYLAAADATAAFSAAYGMPALCALVYEVGRNVSSWSRLKAASGGEDAVVAAQVSITLVMFAVLLCLNGQRLEEAARRPALLLLRHPESSPEAARLVALVEGLRPAVTAGQVAVNSRLLGSVAFGFLTYMVVVTQSR